MMFKKKGKIYSVNDLLVMSNGYHKDRIDNLGRESEEGYLMWKKFFEESNKIINEAITTKKIISAEELMRSLNSGLAVFEKVITNQYNQK